MEKNETELMNLFRLSFPLLTTISSLSRIIPENNHYFHVIMLNFFLGIFIISIFAFIGCLVLGYQTSVIVFLLNYYLMDLRNRLFAPNRLFFNAFIVSALYRNIILTVAKKIKAFWFIHCVPIH